MASSTKVDPIAALVVVLAEAFRQKVTEATVEAYRIGLDGLDIAAAKKALAVAIRTCRFMPTPSELRELSGELRIEDRAVLAFNAFDKAVHRHGYYHTVDFDDRAINATVKALGGWERICETSGPDWNSFFRKRFIENYCAFARAGVSDEAGRPCVGYFDRVNYFNGYESNHLVRIETGLPPMIGITGPVQSIPNIRGQKNGEGPKAIGDVFEKPD